MPVRRGYRRKNTRNNNRNNKRIVNRRKAVRKYAPKAKQNIVKQLMPVAESRVSALKSPGSENMDVQYRVIIPNVWERMDREGRAATYNTQPIQSSFSGNTLFSRYINFQSDIVFDNIRHNQEPVNLVVIQGWWKTPYITEAQSKGDILTTRNAQGVLLGYKPEDYLQFQIASMLTDRFDTIDKKKVKIKFMKEYHIAGKSIQVVNKIGLPPGSAAEIKREAVRRTLTHHFSWKPNRKYHMTPATIRSATDAQNPVNYKPDDPDCFWTPSAMKNEELWIPFICYKFKNYTAFGVNEDGEVDANATPQLYHKQSHYFLDL